ncbi:protein of unknown function [Flaviramulus basaltis]|uniref:DUF4920 domain-containing protein n=1 Tax=Flaviramulus basaltis TaxID=369401 RepID=A0A1K2INI0_9FLAO|nr:DUF4920 domain-containing protein [Flaviramulus basaltis]SFZ93927.1 protein of unknown function [Flaviramulus basaltis]
MLNSCKKKVEESPKPFDKVEEVAYASFGNEIIADDAIVSTSMTEHYKTMNIGDSINSKMIAKVNNVCQAKGCWMTLNLEDGNEVMVKFKDYGFFVPKDIAGKEVVINGKAFVNEVSIDEQRHYAEDAGKSKEEIAQIIKPKKTYSFEADGVLVKQ